MKKGIFFFAILLLGLWAGPALAQEQIESFVAQINIREDTSIQVSENIEYNFGNQDKHGIYRDIPYKYKTDDGYRTIKFTDISVTDENNNPYKFQVSKQGNNQQIKIGDPDVTVTGKKKYIINYTVKKAINYFDEQAELYWNLTGNEWQVPIKQSKAEVQLPTQVKEDLVKVACYTGPSGSQAPCVSTRYKYSAENIVNGFVFVDDKLSANQGVTVVVGFPKDILVEPSKKAEFFEAITDNWISILPLLTFAVMIFFWRTRGRDPEGRGTIIAQFNAPDNLTPAEVGALIDERVHKKDISSEIINLAIEGYLRITRVEDKGFIFKKPDYLLEKLSDGSDLKNKYQRELLNAIFKNDVVSASIKEIKKSISKTNKINKDNPVINTLLNIFDTGTGDNKNSQNKTKKVIKLSSLENKFYKDLERIEKYIYNSVVKKGYFKKNPKKVRSIYFGVGLAVLISSGFFGPLYGAVGVISLVISGVLIIIFSFFMPARTKKGVLAREHIEGLKNYLTVAEKDRIKFHNAPEKNPKQFEKLLPYAMVLGVEKEWAKQFAEMYNQETYWYHDASYRSLTAFALAEGLGSFQSQANTTLASTPSSAASGGSGFSGGGVGGGFGGGGGGSW